jgi:hypothetical protein
MSDDGDSKEVTLEWVPALFDAELGDEKINIIAIGKVVDGYGDDNPRILLLRFAGKPDIHAIRWEVGSVLELGTDSIEHAKASIQAMYQMEGIARV